MFVGQGVGAGGVCVSNVFSGGSAAITGVEVILAVLGTLHPVSQIKTAQVLERACRFGVALIGAVIRRWITAV